MLDSKQIKNLGLRFARALHMTIKTAVMFTVEHKSVERPIQQSFQLLNHLLKEAGQFTFGFVDNQVMLNNLLTSDSSLRNLETEFLKRGIAAVTFEPGLTLGRYKKVISLLSAPSKKIDEVGGILVFLDQNELEGARLLPAAKNQKKDEHGDTVIETDSEAYIMSKQMAEDQAPRDLLDSIDALLESAWFDPATRAEYLSDFASRGMDGSGYGVAIEGPTLVLLKEGEAVGPAASTPETAAEKGASTGERAGLRTSPGPTHSGHGAGTGGTAHPGAAFPGYPAPRENPRCRPWLRYRPRLIGVLGRRQYGFGNPWVRRCGRALQRSRERGIRRLHGTGRGIHPTLVAGRKRESAKIVCVSGAYFANHRSG